MDVLQMAELPDLERLVEENGIPVFGFTQDFGKYPSMTGIPVEDVVSYPFFNVNTESPVYEAFLHQLNPSKGETGDVFEEGAERFIPTVEMPVYPKTLFIYGENNSCFVPAGQTYTSFLEQANVESCPQFVLQKSE